MIKRILKNHYLLFTGLLLLTITTISDSYLIPFYKKLQLEDFPKTFQKEIFEKSAFADSLIATASKKVSKSNKINFSPLSRRAKNENLHFYAYYKGNLVFWNTNSVLPKKKVSSTRGFRTVKRGNGLYLQKSRKPDNYTFKVLLPLRQSYKIKNDYLKDDIKIPAPTSNSYDINRNQVGHSISNSNGDYLFSLNPQKFSWKAKEILCFYLAGLIFVFLSFTQITRKLFLKGRFYKAFGLIALWIGFILAYPHWITYPQELFNLSIFSRDIFPANDLIPSLGYFFLAVVHLSVFVHYLTKHWTLPIKPKTGFSTYALVAILFLLTTVGSHLILSALNSWITHSNIYLGSGNLERLNGLSALALGSLFLLFYTLITLSYWFYNHIKIFAKNNYASIIGAFLLIILLYQFGCQEGLFPKYYAALFSLLIWLGFLAFYPLNLTFYSPLIFLVAICSGYSAIYLGKFNEEKAVQNQKQYATQVTYQRDALAERLFRNVSREIKTDKYAKNFFFNPLLSRQFLKQRIQELYLNRYLQKYKFKIHTYKYGGIPYKGKQEKPLSYFQNLVNKYGLKAPAKNLYYINKTGTSPAYLAFYRFKAYGENYGTLVLELQEKVFYEDRIYPDLLVSEQNLNKDSDKDYDYSIYKQNKLIAQEGQYPYKTIDSFINNSQVYKTKETENYVHLYHQVSHNAFVIVTREKESTLNKLSIFSSLFISYFILTLLLISILRTSDFPFILNFRSLSYAFRNPFRNVLFLRKIQLIILFTALCIMVTVGFSTVSYLKKNFKDQLIKDVSNKTKKIVPLVEDFLQNTPRATVENSKEQLFAHVRTLTKRFQTDINIYNLRGSIITTSQPTIYEKGIISEKMNPIAYKKMRVQNKAQLIQEESIGTLTYLASYAPIRNEDNKVIGFINIPYFSQQPIIQNEISSLIVTLINLYFLIFLLIIFVSLIISNTITRPLNLIREKLRRTQLSQQNEPIDWQSRDELGQLIQEYNQMIADLDKNAKVLAQSEREGAWREMARQVAHEIKNPLTPIKLNIQHLQRQFPPQTNQSQNSVTKISNTLTTQIDHLAKIADDFSAFAKISLGNPAFIDPNQDLKDQIAFLARNQGVPINTYLDSNPPFIWVDPNHLNRIINNLVKNAFEAMEDQKDPSIAIGSFMTGSKTFCLWITDKGPGIPADKKEKIFQPNFSTKNSGTGLGLAMIKKMMENSEGSITFSSKENKGTTFYLYFLAKKKE